MTIAPKLRQRSLLAHGLRLVITTPGALLWTYAFNVGIALLFSLYLHAQLASLLDHSLAAERLNSAFDLGTLSAASLRLSQHTPSAGATTYLGLPVYLAIYFLLVPGTLVCYRTGRRGRLSDLLAFGLQFFWRFIRITLITGLVSAIILGPLLVAYGRWSAWVDEHVVGWPAYWDVWAVLAIVLLVAAAVRLYFDLVEVYTVQLGEQMKPNGMPDRRVRRTLLPALRAFGLRPYAVFVFLTLLGWAAFFFPARIAVHTLAQPRVWPSFLLEQLGLFLMLATRFWQRGAETILADDNPLPMPPVAAAIDRHLAETVGEPAAPGREGERIGPAATTDPIPDPEPAVPSLTEPDAGIFHHEPAEPAE
jgi:hypothetical protein